MEFVLLAPTAPTESDATRGFRLAAQTSLDQRDGLDAVGETTKGTLWRVTIPVAARAEASVPAWAGWIAPVQLSIIAIALLLAVPTSSTRRAAQRTSRIVGPYWREGR